MMSISPNEYANRNPSGTRKNSSVQPNDGTARSDPARVRRRAGAASETGSGADVTDIGSRRDDLVPYAGDLLRAVGADVVQELDLVEVVRPDHGAGAERLGEQADDVVLDPR